MIQFVVTSFICDCRTLTTPVELLKCLQSIKEHAFSVSPYPVIITLEDHLSPNLQAKVAEVDDDFLLGYSPLCVKSPI